MRKPIVARCLLSFAVACILTACSAVDNPCVGTEPGDGSIGAACADDVDCREGECDYYETFQCICVADQGGSGGTGGTAGTGGTGGSADCPAVDVAPGTVPLEGACDGDADCANDVVCTDCVCAAPQVASCDDPLQVVLRVNDADAQCETVFNDSTGTYREIEVAQQQVQVGYTTAHALSLVRWDPAVQALDDPQYDESVVGPVMLDLFPATPYAVAVEVTDTCNPPRTAEDILIVVSDDAFCE